MEKIQFSEVEIKKKCVTKYLEKELSSCINRCIEDQPEDQDSHREFQEFQGTWLVLNHGQETGIKKC